MLGFSAQANAFIRHLYSYLAGIVTVLGIAGVSPDVQQQIVTSVHQIGDGVTSILAGVGPLVVIVMGLIARWTAKPEQQKAAVNAMPDVQVVPAPGYVAPSPNSVTLKSSAWAPVLFLIVLFGVAAGGAGFLHWVPLLFVAVLLAIAGQRLTLRSSSATFKSSGWLPVLLVACVIAGTLGACTYTTSGGTPVVLNAANLPQIVADLAKRSCTQYVASKVTDDALIKIATGVINTQSVTNGASTVEGLAALVCPFLATPAAPVAPPAAASSSSG
jgi:hypothetical protein